MKITRQAVAATLLAACFATSAFAAGEADAPPAPDQAGAVQDGPGHDSPGRDSPGRDGPWRGGPAFGGPGGPGGPGAEGGPHGFGMHGGPDEGMLGHLHRLNLSEAQQDKLFAIHHAAEPERREHMKAVRKAHEALAELARAERFDDARATALSRDLGQAIAAEALLQARTEAQALALLTPGQRDQLRKHRRPGPQLRAGQAGK